MTDLEKLKKTFDEIGVKYDEVDSLFKPGYQEIEINSQDQFTGLRFVFDDYGKFECVLD